MKHVHHRIPRHMGGTDDPSNLFECSVEEHAELHFALYLEYGKVADWVAFNCLSGKTDEAEIMRVELSREAMKSWVPTEEQRKKMSESASRPKGDEFKQKMREVRTGWEFSEETRNRISDALTGKKRGGKKKVIKRQDISIATREAMRELKEQGKPVGRRARRVEYNGKVYDSMSHLREETGMRQTTAYNLINKGEARYI